MATDGRQLLVQRGFTFPWPDDLLIPSSKAYACKELVEAGEVCVARTDTHVVLRAGRWTLFAPIDKEGRYPRVDDVAPRQSRIATRCRFDPVDAAFLAAGLPRLPGGKEDHSPVTVSLDQDVVVRAREGDGPITELTLAKSEHSGNAARLCVDRNYLSRALALGFDTLEIEKPDVPMTFRDDCRTYTFMPMCKDGAIATSEDGVRINSADVSNNNQTPPRRKQPVSTTPSENGHAATNGDGHPDTSSNGDGTAKSAKKSKPKREKSPTAKGLIEEAIALRNMLREACSRSNAVIAALKEQHRQGRLLRETIASLRQLQQVGGE